MQENKSKLFKQRLFRLHIAAGVIFSIIMYIAIFFGIFAILLPYIKTWEKPSRHIQTTDIFNIDYNYMINKVLEDENFPKDDILVNLPGRMNDPAVIITNPFVKPIAFNPITKQKLEDETNKNPILLSF